MSLIRIVAVTIAGFVAGCSPVEESVDHPEIAGPTQIALDLPSVLRVSKRTDGVIIAQGGNANILIARCPKSSFRGMRSNLAQKAAIGKPGSDQVAMPEESFQLGDAEGHKYLIKSAGSSATLEARYLLKVPGGYLAVIISSEIGDDGPVGFSEADFEPVISKGRIVTIDRTR